MGVPTFFIFYGKLWFYKKISYFQLTLNKKDKRVMRVLV
ncbi:conserved hypothetical protein [Leptospira interrogans serovar Manilae]|uniref:Uncharacterized protein n=1 Tax=Leptospira interrogans serovar Manilae TaxID=214675 RepID=A0AAQ1SQW7_LEPIR|nr:conserved hypothetical protein [Leptospira interrogans serovar Manilae]